MFQDAPVRVSKILERSVEAKKSLYATFQVSSYALVLSGDINESRTCTGYTFRSPVADSSRRLYQNFLIIETINIVATETVFHLGKICD